MLPINFSRPLAKEGKNLPCLPKPSVEREPADDGDHGIQGAKQGERPKRAPQGMARSPLGPIQPNEFMRRVARKSKSTANISADFVKAQERPPVPKTTAEARMYLGGLLSQMNKVNMVAANPATLTQQKRNQQAADDALLARLEASPHNFMNLSSDRKELSSIVKYGLSPATKKRAQALLAHYDDALTSTGSLHGLTPPTTPKPTLLRSPLVANTFTWGSWANGLNRRSNEYKDYANLTFTSGNTYWVSPVINQGAFKSFCVAINSDLQAFACLVMREAHAPDKVVGMGRDKPRHAPGGMDAGEIAKEIAQLSVMSETARMYDLGSVEGTWFVVTTLFDAGDLTEAFSALKPAKRQEAALIVLPEILEQLNALHNDKKMAHCDIKMANIFASSSGSVALGDFGFATHMRRDGGCPPAYAGTYVAPEVWHYLGHDGAADLWSLGASFGDLFVHDQPNPFCLHVEDARGKLQGAHILSSYSLFRERLYDNQGTFYPDFLLGQSKPETQAFDRFFKAMYTQAPSLTAFVLDRFLNPNPRLRQSDRGQDLLACAQLLRDYSGLKGRTTQGLFPKMPAIVDAIDTLQGVCMRENKMIQKRDWKNTQAMGALRI